MRAKVLEIIPVSVYQKKVFTQDIRVRLDDGTELSLFDPQKECSEEFVNTVVDIGIYINSFQSVKYKDNRQHGIFPAPKKQGPYADICGEYKGISERNSGYWGLVNNIGGKIWIDLGEYQARQLEEFNTGDPVCFEKANMYLKNIDR